MKPKGINFFEQHIEKLVLGLFLLVFLGVLVLQITTPVTVEVDGQSMSPADARQRLMQSAIARDNAMDGGHSIALPDTPTDIASSFERRVSEPVAPNETLLAFAEGAELPEADAVVAVAEDRPDGDGQAEFALPEAPAPASVAAAVYAGTIDPLTVAQREELAALVPDEQPYDKFFVSVEARFDAAALREAERLAAEADNVQPLLPEMRSRMELARVVLVRQRLGSTGWSEEQEIAGLPGRFDLTQAISEDTTPVQFDALFERERQSRGEIRRSDMYYLVSGEPWERPAARRAKLEAERAELPEEVSRLLNQLRSVDREIARLERRLEEADEMPTPRDRDDDRRGSLDTPWTPLPETGWPEIPATWRAQFGGPGGGGGEAPEEEGDNLSRIEQRLERQRERRADIVDQLESLGYDETGRPMLDAEAGEPDADLLPLFNDENDGFTIWGHDLTAEPGETYRYAIRVQLTNPLFAFQDRVPDSQATIAEQPLLDGAQSDWSEPVVVPQRIRYFVTSAEPASLGPLGPRDASASIEAFVFFYGHWRRAEARLRPGDAIAATAEVDPDLPRFVIEEQSGRDGGPTLAREPGTLDQSSVDVRLAEFLIDVAQTLSDGLVNVALIRSIDGRLIERIAGESARQGLIEQLRAEAAAADEAEVRTPVGDMNRERVPGRGDGPSPGGEPGGGGGGAGGGGSGFGGGGFGGGRR